MKIIDLLNKIANGEKVPKKIKYYDIKYKYDGKFYYTSDGFSMYRSMYTEGNCLNDEVEIIEEDKKIENAKLLFFEETGEAIMHPRIEEYNENNFKELKRVTDELIKEIEKLKGKSE